MGAPNDSVVVTMWSHVVRLGPTRYLVGPVNVAGRLAIYRSDGTLDRVIRLKPAFFPDGTPWESPHQVGPMFESASGAAVVLDMGNGRLMLVDTVGGLRTYASLRGSVFGGLSLPDGRMVINAQYPPGESLGRPLHIIDNKRIVRSIGPAAGRLGPLSTSDFRVLASARGGNFWTSPHDRYELSLMDSLGRVATTLTRPFASAAPGPGGTMAFGVASIREDADGYLWVVSLRREGVSDVKADERITPATIRGLAAGLTSTVDIIDPRRGEVIYSQSFAGPATPFIADGLVYRHRDDASGTHRIEVVSMRLTRPNAR